MKQIDVGRLKIDFTIKKEYRLLGTLGTSFTSTGVVKITAMGELNITKVESKDIEIKLEEVLSRGFVHDGDGKYYTTDMIENITCHYFKYYQEVDL